MPLIEKPADGILIAWLDGAAHHWGRRIRITLHRDPAADTTEIESAAVAELAELAGGRDDLLYQVAGLLLGAYPCEEDPGDLVFRCGAGLLLAAVRTLPDPALVEHWRAIGARRVDDRPRGDPHPDPPTYACGNVPFRFRFASEPCRGRLTEQAPHDVEGKA